MNTEMTSELGERIEGDMGNLVVTQTGNNPPWEAPVQLRGSDLAAILIPADLAARAAFLAQFRRGVLPGRPLRK